VGPKKVTSTDGRSKVDDYWESSKKALWGDSKLQERLLSYDRDNIPDDVMALLKPLENDPSFDPEVIKKASVAAFGICKWIRAMIVYDAVIKVVAPRREKLSQAEHDLQGVMMELGQKKAELTTVHEFVSALMAQFERAKNRNNELRSEVEVCEKRLNRAEKLINGLAAKRPGGLLRPSSSGSSMTA
jgi:dynein heavy chain